ncbi:hypothetical protein A4R63_00665 [Corynebacterium pseudotuberculosis]|uniref:DUF5819 family protein n=1 Tax=Corynebacterium pseudotuberculosis TaxID=1719 RepID=UPI0006559C7A|nr:DUF5819 family protein [Corynebacterium pseudotuberculosis]AKN59561.1 hypothetical protein CP31_00680 [Corynebacterium pseudotuberculosis 31]APB10084.1 hypothetical protein A4R72_00665 [Corynebacterium pseudotuberculosis]APB12130.1 hypothetical protein A4R71_00670 [Corynebacterium pseudotuberculosis]APB14177.1 hypothetical protein A4R68_00665 [Corynebacterium pseudotuberculosis]APB16228.1 hypothetical protein A4R67_00670 [Corynebacterium pseudotuberculosis]
MSITKKEWREYSPLKSVSYCLFTWLSIIAIALYAISALLYNLPDGYGKQRIAKTNSLMDPVFTQNWSLFAPEAPLTDVGFLARIKTNGADQEFQDISSPALNREKGKLIPDRKYRLLSGAFVAYVQAEEALYDAAHGEGSYPGVFMASNSVINSMMEETGSIGKEEKNTYRAITELFYSVAASFLEAEGVSSRYLCDEGDSMQVRIVGVPISGMTDRDDEVEVRNLRWASC